MAADPHQAEFYNETYGRPNYFRYQSWLYKPYVSSLVAYCELKQGASILDVGCGQGFFSYLLGKKGMKVHGVDMSEIGVAAARRLYGELGITFSVSDIQEVTFPKQFDCVFVRSCSLYNTDTFPSQPETTDRLLTHLKPGGSFIFVYNTNFSSRVSQRWRYHSLEDVTWHFKDYSNARVFFLNKFTTYLLRRLSFTNPAKQLNIALSKLLGVGGDIICVLQKDPRPLEKDTIVSA
jgi:SAM-dependent methyltransferase